MNNTKQQNNYGINSLSGPPSQLLHQQAKQFDGIGKSYQEMTRRNYRYYRQGWRAALPPYYPPPPSMRRPEITDISIITWHSNHSRGWQMDGGQRAYQQKQRKWGLYVFDHESGSPSLPFALLMMSTEWF